jgi:hypothetical protein
MTDIAAHDYDAEERVPLAGYATVAGAFGASLAAFAVVVRRRGVTLPERVPPWDLLLLGAATYKTSRLLTKDKITSFLRAPFTRREEDTTAGEVMDEPRGNGVRLAMGDLLSCPFCAGAWTAGSLMATYAVAPRAARLVCAGFGAMTLADWLQYAWTWTQEKVEG